MSSNRLELYYGTYATVMLGIVIPIISGTIGILIIYLAIYSVYHISSALVWLSIQCGASFGGYFCLLSLFSLLRSRSLFAKEPQIIINAQGITDNRNWKIFAIPWSAIQEISFPHCRELARRKHVLRINFSNPQQYRSRMPFIRKIEKRRVSYPGDYEISLYYCKENALDIYFGAVL